MSEPPSYDEFQFAGTGRLSANNEAIVEKLDELEVQVEKLRASASEMEEWRQQLTKCLTDISETSNKSTLTAGHREELEANINRVMLRLLAVNIKVDIPRTPDQEMAYGMVKKLLAELENKLESGLDECKLLLQSYLNACSSEQAAGPVDSRFQQTILACTVDDQRQVRKVLSNWIHTFREIQDRWAEAYRVNAKKL